MTARRSIAAILVLIASILAPISVGALWAQRTLTDTETFVETISPLADDPQVQQTVKDSLSDALIERIDAVNRLDKLLPGGTAVAEALASGVNSAVENGVDRFVEAEVFGESWVAMAGALQAQVLRLLGQGDPGAVTLEEGQLVLDTGVALRAVQAELVERGVPLVGSVDLSAAGRDIVLVETPNLQRAADVLEVFLPVATWMWLAVLLLLLAGILLWPHRARGMLWAGIGLLVSGTVTWFALDLGLTRLAESSPSPNLADVLAVVISTLTRFLEDSILVMTTLGAVLALAGWLAGGTRSGARVREAVIGPVRGFGAPLADTAIGGAAARTPLLVPALRGVVIVLAVWWLLAADRLDPARIAWACAAAVAGLLLVEVVEGAGRHRDELVSGAVVAD
ncbi:MAG: hypothetical protein WCF04_03460 [Candidatus Nanopelagicales bacterium]